jgi:fructose-1,6-bisphosphatase/inositol monophosphatase family enzyme
MQTFARELEMSRALARKAGEIAMRSFRTGLAFESKDDLSPVTAVDRECERMIAGELEQVFGDDGLLGEEGARKESRNGRRWIIDPIDGTRDFVRGSPAWAVLIGFEASGEVAAGAAFLPALGDLYSACRGGGAWVNDRRIHASPISRREDAVLCVNGLNAVADRFAGRLLEWMRPFWAVRSMGGSVDAMMVAGGQADLWLEMSGKPWDFAALKIIAEEAGARFFNFDGGSSIYGGNCIICAPGLETAARRFLSGSTL